MSSCWLAKSQPVRSHGSYRKWVGCQQDWPMNSLFSFGLLVLLFTVAFFTPLMDQVINSFTADLVNQRRRKETIGKWETFRSVLENNFLVFQTCAFCFMFGMSLVWNWTGIRIYTLQFEILFLNPWNKNHIL